MDTMLIVDEDNIAREGLANLFDHFIPELKTSLVDNGKQALEMVNAFQPDYILMDISFTDIKGLVLLHKIRSCCPNSCIVVFTEKDFPEYREACYEQGANFFISKLDNPVSDVLILISSHVHSKYARED